MILHSKLIENDQMATLHMEGENISRIEPFMDGSGMERVDPDIYLAPGFFDPQVNGFGGVDFNGIDLTPADVHRAAQAVCATGVTTFFPTLITASYERLSHQLNILKEAIENYPFVSKMCRGIHLEGPYLSSSGGPRGVHPVQFIRLPRWEEFERLQEVSGGRIKLITLAPEKEGSLHFIEKAVSNGVVAAIGHTEASGEILDAAFEAGARLSTHLGNGIGNLILRRRNPFQKQLTMDGLMASIIADGIHLQDYVVRNILRAKGSERILLCSDAISAALQPPGKYSLGGLEVDVGDDGATRLVGTGGLAGSTLSIPRAISNLIKFTGVDLRTAVKTATENGRNLFPEMIGTIAPNQPANLVLFRFKEELTVEKTILFGKEIFMKPSL